jgi:hypothetical protein
MKTHSDGAVCPGCEIKLRDAHGDIQRWFREEIKPMFQDCHVSWSFRGKIEQNQAVAEGKSKLPWPLSAHNKSDDQGNPCSLAVDLFELSSNGMASWSWKYFKEIADHTKARGFPIVWGGDFKTLGDSDHFQFQIE